MLRFCTLRTCMRSYIRNNASVCSSCNIQTEMRIGGINEDMASSSHSGFLAYHII